MNLIPIQVQCYAGYKSDESPRRFLYESTSVEIKEILDRWYQGNRDPEWPITDYFEVLGSDGREYLLKHDREYDDWFLVNQGASNCRQTSCSPCPRAANSPKNLPGKYG